MNKIAFYTVDKVMTKNVICANSEDTLEMVNKIFCEKGIHHLPVLNLEGILIGLISTTDLDKVRWGKSMIMENQMESANNLLFSTYRTVDIMSKPVITLTPSSLIKEAILKFQEENIRAIPIVNQKQVVGILSPIDILNLLI